MGRVMNQYAARRISTKPELLKSSISTWYPTLGSVFGCSWDYHVHYSERVSRQAKSITVYLPGSSLFPPSSLSSWGRVHQDFSAQTCGSLIPCEGGISQNTRRINVWGKYIPDALSDTFVGTRGFLPFPNSNSELNTGHIYTHFHLLPWDTNVFRIPH